MTCVYATKRLLAGLLAFVFVLAVAQAAAAGLPGGELRYHDGAWIKEQRFHPAATVQYRYHDGWWVRVTAKSHAKSVIRPAARPDDRAGARGIG